MRFTLSIFLIRRPHRHRPGPRRIGVAFGGVPCALRLQRGDRPGRLSLLDNGGGELRLFPGAQGCPPGSHHGAKARMSSVKIDIAPEAFKERSAG